MEDGTVFDGYGIRIAVEHASLPDGREKTVARIHRCDAVTILAFPTPRTVLLLREYRPFFGAYVWMLPSGKVDKETDILAAAQRELREETGFRAADLRPYFSSSFSEQFAFRNHVFLARDLAPDPLPQDAAEMIEVHEVPVEDAAENTLRDPMHPLSALALLRYLREHGV